MPEASPKICHVVVAVPTFKRPHMLERLLGALEKLETRAQVSVIVGDNDSENHQGFDLCESLKPHYRWPLIPIIVAERGIAQNRNALAEAALTLPDTQFIAMLDDDEWPDPHWLDAFLDVQAQTGADALHGAVLRAYDEERADLAEGWAKNWDGMGDLRGATGPVAMIEGTGNVMMTRGCFDDLPRPWFDPGFALTGGEDRDFFFRLKQLGKTFAWADEAKVQASVPASRASLGWALKRAYRVGNSDMRVFLKYGPAWPARARELAKIAGAILLFPFLFAILVVVPNRRSEPLRKLARAAGKTAALFGRYYNEYAVVHGG
ncbi:MAG TPA: glycosyltransferase family 2 protein [Rhizomicrobium sp.]|nr:glycosyltransferase family 2 protein [Rhizomicrobium sp.]